MSSLNYPHGAPPGAFTNFNSLNRWLRQLWHAFTIVRNGKLDCIDRIILTPSVATTVFTNSLLAPESFIDLDPLTANAAAEKAAGTLYVLAANRLAGSCTITHANNAQADREFNVLIIGG